MAHYTTCHISLVCLLSALYFACKMNIKT